MTSSDGAPRPAGQGQHHEPMAPPRAELPTDFDRLIGAACTLGPELRQRLDDWRALRHRATAIDEIGGGVRLTFGPEEAMDAVARLVSLESECCAFYTFTLRVNGPTRQLEIDAGPGGEPAVRALLGLDR
jgi:hypothetical protein